MNKVQQSILDNVVAPALDRLGSARVARIAEFNPNTKEATISFAQGYDPDTRAVDYKQIKYVPMVRQEGTHESGPFIGDEVLINFINNDFSKPIIIGAVPKDYALNRKQEREMHENKGSYVVNHYTKRTGDEWHVEKFRI